MQLFYCDNININGLSELSPDESAHCVSVLRKRSGDKIQLTNGKGILANAEISYADKHKCLLQVNDITNDYGRRNYSLEIAIAPTKNMDRFEWFVEKAVETGIDRIVPLLCEHSERKNINHDRLERLMLAAAKQSLKTYFPQLMPLISVKDYILTLPDNVKKAIAYCDEGQKILPSQAFAKNESVSIMIGPEGDFSPNEVMLAIQKGYIPLSLGESRFRTETAGLMACMAVYLINQ